MNLGQTAAQRHSGIDLLRAVSMIMICILHVNYLCLYGLTRQEGGWEWLSWGGTESLCIIAVNLYAMITGYVCITSSWRISRYIALWFQVVFYTVGIYALGLFLAHEGWLPKIALKTLLSDLCTVPLAGAYWYFNAYTALFLLIPFLNKLLQKLSRADYAKLLVALLVFLPLMKAYGGGGQWRIQCRLAQCALLCRCLYPSAPHTCAKAIHLSSLLSVGYGRILHSSVLSPLRCDRYSLRYGILFPLQYHIGIFSVSCIQRSKYKAAVAENSHSFCFSSYIRRLPRSMPPGHLEFPPTPGETVHHRVRASCMDASGGRAVPLHRLCMCRLGEAPYLPMVPYPNSGG